jgi:hypothetical protein
VIGGGGVGAFEPTGLVEIPSGSVGPESSQHAFADCVVSEVASGHLTLNPKRVMPPGEWHELFILQERYGAEQMLVWQARAYRRSRPHPYGITPSYYEACAAADAIAVQQPASFDRSELNVVPRQTSSTLLDPACDELLRTMGIRQRRQLSDVSLDLILAWQSALDHPGLKARFTSPLGFAMSQMRCGNTPPSQEELDLWENQARKKTDPYHSWRHIPSHTDDISANVVETDLEARVRAIAPPGADLAMLCEIARLIEAGLSDQEVLVQVCKPSSRGML